MSIRQIKTKRARGAPLPIDVEPEDPSSWPYTDDPRASDPDDAPWPADRAHADDVVLADFAVGPHETLCSSCWLVHRPDVECC